jgi:hypothetical protein
VISLTFNATSGVDPLQPTANVSFRQCRMVDTSRHPAGPASEVIVTTLENIMSRAGTMFERSIGDAENILTHFNSLNDKPPKPELEVLKRAGLIMAMTAWETYVEDRVLEGAAERLSNLSDKSIAEFMQSKLEEEIKRLNNPVSEKVIALFRDYAGIDEGRPGKSNSLLKAAGAGHRSGVCSNSSLARTMREAV